MSKNKPHLLHAIAYCEDCDWEETWYLTAVKKANYHAKKTGHTVTVETGYSKTLNEKE